MLATHPNYPERLDVPKLLTDGSNLSREEKKKLVAEYLSKRPEYTDYTVLSNEHTWADRYNVSFDELKSRKVWINNKLVPLYKTGIRFVNNRPITPVLTGLTGRGMLGRFGPNHAADPIVTRYNPVTKDLEFVAGLRSDTNEDLWCIPGGMVDEGEPVSTTLRREFMEEAAKTCREDVLDDIFVDGDVLYAGPTYGDPRTTDQAWIETYVVHYHIDDYLANLLPLSHQEGENKKVEWISCDATNLYGDHKKFIKMAKSNQEYKEYKTIGGQILSISCGIIITLLIAYWFR